MSEHGKPKQYPPSTFNFSERAFRPGGAFTKVIPGLSEKVQSFHREGRLRSAMDEIFKALDQDPHNAQALDLAMIVMGGERQKHLQASEPLTEAYRADRRIDPIFAVCSHCKVTEWVPSNQWLADLTDSSVSMLNPSGLQCYSCGYVMCRDCMRKTYNIKEGDVYPNLCPNCGKPDLRFPVYPTGRPSRQMEQYLGRVERIVVFREGPVPPDVDYIENLLPIVSPDALIGGIRITGIALSVWPDKLEAFVATQLWTLYTTEGASSNIKEQVLSNAHFHTYVDQWGTRVCFVKIIRSISPSVTPTPLPPVGSESSPKSITQRPWWDLRNLFGRTKISQPERPPQPIFVEKRQNGASTFEVYRADDAEIAKTFLLTKRVDQKQYYIIVDTPDGNWGVDVNGLYLEKLRSWQVDLAQAQAEGRMYHPENTNNAEIAARNINDNYVTKVACGSCKYEWYDGIRYQNLTIVRCPKCNKYNKVDSTNFTVAFAQNQQNANITYNSLALFFFDSDMQARSAFAALTEVCRKLGGLTQELSGTVFEFLIAPTSVRVIAVRAVNDRMRNNGLELLAACGIFGDSKPQATEQGNPEANQYKDFDDLLKKCVLTQIINFSELPVAPASQCVVCKGSGQLRYMSPHSRITANHSCPFCRGSGKLP